MDKYEAYFKCGRLARMRNELNNWQSENSQSTDTDGRIAHRLMEAKKALGELQSELERHSA